MLWYLISAWAYVYCEHFTIVGYFFVVDVIQLWQEFILIVQPLMIFMNNNLLDDHYHLYVVKKNVKHHTDKMHFYQKDSAFY